MKQVVADYINLSKPRIVLLFVITGVTAMIMEGSLLNEPIRLWAIILGIALTGASANVLNQYLDRDIDSLMERTAKKRPLPLGKMSPNAALMFGLGLGVIAFWLLARFGTYLAAWIGMATIFYYVVIYTMWLKRRTPYNIVIGGAAGATAPLIGWAAATNNVSLLAFWLFVIIFMWTPPHFWALALVVKDEYAKASVPMLPVVAGEKRTRLEILIYTFLMVPVSLFPSITRSAGPAYTLIAALLGSGFIYFAIRMFKKRDNRSYYSLFGYSIVYLLTLFLVMGVTTLVVSHASAAESIPRELQGIGVDEHRGNQVDPNLTFKDEQGQDVQLNHYLGRGKPVALYLVYYGCPTLCGFFLNGITDSMRRMNWTPGKEYEIITVSIDPREKPVLAQAKKNSFIKLLGRPHAADGWHFLTGTEGAIKALTTQVGFKYRYDKESDQYAHVPVATILTPTGVVSRYLYGIEYKPLDLKLALNEAGSGKVGTLIDQLVLFCYHYDPKTKKYALYAMNAMRMAGGTTVFLMGSIFWLGYRKRRLTHHG